MINEWLLFVKDKSWQRNLVSVLILRAGMGGSMSKKKPATMMALRWAESCQEPAKAIW